MFLVSVSFSKLVSKFGRICPNVLKHVRKFANGFHICTGFFPFGLNQETYYWQSYPLTKLSISSSSENPICHYILLEPYLRHSCIQGCLDWRENLWVKSGGVWRQLHREIQAIHRIDFMQHQQHSSLQTPSTMLSGENLYHENLLIS